MLSNLPETVKALMVEALSKIDSAVNNNVDESKPFDSIYRIGTVKWNSPKTNGQIPLWLGIPSVCDKTGHSQSTAAVRFTDETFAIIVTTEDFKHSFNLIPTIAHEVGHFIKGHLYQEGGDFVNLYKDKLKKHADSGEQEELNKLTSAAVIDGGCLERELEADMEAIKFVGIPSVILIHLEGARNHINPLARMEKLNRIKHLYDKLESNHKLYAPRNGWRLDIVVWDADKIKEEAEKEK